MSRTFRKRIETYPQYWSHRYTIWDTKNKLKKDTEHFHFKPEGWESYKVDEVKYYTDFYSKGYFRRKFPKHYRKMVNRGRRRRDRVELWKEINLDGYEGLYSAWNCRDSDPMWYW